MNKAEYDSKYGANIEPYLSLYQGYNTTASATAPYTGQKPGQTSYSTSSTLDLNPVSSHHAYQTPNSAVFRLVIKSESIMTLE